MQPERRRLAAAVAIAAALVLAACTQSGDETSTAETSTTTATSAADPATTAATAATSATSTTATSTTATTNTSSTTSPLPTPSECNVAPVPPEAGLDPFYTQGCSIDGFWVVANDVVEPLAIVKAADTVAHIFATDDRLAPTLAATGIRLGIIGRSQRTTEMPEYRDLYEVFPETDWDNRARGLGATIERPLVSAGEENILCLPNDRYLGEDILLHEFSHVLHEFGYSILDADFDTDLFAAYQQALDDGIWADTYAATNHHEYWAEGVQSYVGRNLSAEPADGIHGPIDTEAELRQSDPALHALIDRRLGELELPPRC